MKKKKKTDISNTRLIMGKNCVSEVLKESPERVESIFLSNEETLRSEIDRANIPFHVKRKQELSDLVDSDSHQGVVARVKEKKPQTLFDFLQEPQKKTNSLVLALDSIFDPQNLGSLLRAAECFGVDAVLWSKNRGSSMTPVVAKASVGASELVQTIQVSNLVESIKKMKEADYWCVTAELGERSQSLYHFEFPEKTVLVMGSEGKGLQKLVSRQADFKVFIPMAGRIDSLNVSQAASVFLSHWKKQI